MYLETSCFEMTARKQCFLTIYVLHRHRGYCFGCFFQLFPIVRNIWPHLFSFTILYTVSGDSHTCTGRDSLVPRPETASLGTRLRQRCHVGAVDCSCTISCRRSARGMCSMNISSFFCDCSMGHKRLWYISILNRDDVFFTILSKKPLSLLGALYVRTEVSEKQCNIAYTPSEFRLGLP